MTFRTETTSGFQERATLYVKTVCGKFNINQCSHGQMSVSNLHILLSALSWVAFYLLNISILNQLPFPYPDGEWVIKRSTIARKPKTELMRPRYSRAPGIPDEHTSAHRALWCVCRITWYLKLISSNSSQYRSLQNVLDRHSPRFIALRRWWVNCPPFQTVLGLSPCTYPLTWEEI